MYKGRATRLVESLKLVERAGGDFWTFRGCDGRSDAHALFHYPAMMVPQVQGKILDLILSKFPNATKVLDPFVGSGTTLVESMYRGMDFVGIDINPLAGLLSMVKANPLDEKLLREASYRLFQRLSNNISCDFEDCFKNQQKWFEPSTIIHLARLKKAIQQERNIFVRRVFWVALARCIRRVSNSRLSTYKLHTLPRAAIALRTQGVTTEIFAECLNDIGNQLSLFNRRLARAGVLHDGAYRGSTNIIVQDACKFLHGRKDTRFDIVITSPPYGDNATTVPYGQYSFLPMMWIPLADVDLNANPSLLKNTHSTDTASLGGSLVNALDRGEEACGNYATYQKTMRSLNGFANGQKRLAAFAADLDRSIKELTQRTARNGLHVWTIGDRSICGKRVPMCDLLAEILAGHGVTLLHKAARRIVSKKMAFRNTISETISNEQILIGHKV